MVSCVNEVLTHEIEWPHIYEREELGEQLPLFEGCIGFVDGILVKIICPYRDPNHYKFLMDVKINIPSTTPSLLIITVCLFMWTLDIQGPTMMWLVCYLLRWIVIGEHTLHTQTIILNTRYQGVDPRYQGVDQYIVHRLGCHEAPKNVDNEVIM